MKKLFLFSITIAFLLLFPKINIGQIPDFGDASGFAVFTTAGAFANVGPSIVTGDVGNNSGAFAAFPPGELYGQIHSLDAVSEQAATSLFSVDAAFIDMACDTTIAPALGNGQVITPGVYCQADVSTLTGDLTLDAQGDPNAIFVIKLGGTFTTAPSSNVIFTNSASLCNVYWHVVGAVVLGTNSSFSGTIVSNGAITLNDGAVLSGRALTTNGAISLTNNIISIAAPPTASEISASGPTVFCSGDSVLLSGNVDGIWNNAEITPSITVNSGDDYFVTNSNAFCTIESNHINVTVNPLPTATVGNSIAICNGNDVTLGAAAVAGNTYAWIPATGLSSSTTANPVANPTETTTYTLTETITATGCNNTNSVTVTVDTVLSASQITASGPTTFCGNEFVVLSGNIGGTWSNTASISTPSLTVNTSGDYFVTDTNACNNVISNHIIITVNPQPAAITGNDVSICDGTFASLGGATISGHTYSWTPATGLNSATSAHPYASPLTSTIYTLTETDTATACYEINSVLVTVNPLPPATTVTNAAICSGESVAIGGNSTTGNTYLWAPIIDLNSPTISNPVASPTDTVVYTLTETIVATGCSQSNSVTVLVNAAPDIITQPADQDVLIGSPAVFYVDVTGTDLIYQWRKGQTNLINSSNISGADTDSLTVIAVSLADTSISYNVVISGACVNNTISQNASLSIALPSDVVFSDLTNSSETVSIFPNPFTSSINVVVNDLNQTNLEITFYNVLGIKVMSRNLISKLNSIETTDFEPAIYLYYVKSNGNNLFYDGYNDAGFDKVINPELTGPLVQVTMHMAMRYTLKRDVKE